MFQRQARQPFPVRNILLLGAAVLGFLFFLFKTLSPGATQPAGEEAEEAAKKGGGLWPNEQFFTSRDYPEFRPDVAMLSTALEMATAGVASRGPNGPLSAPWTVQGPANIGARINTIKVHPTNPNVIYIGYSMGGVWKSTNGGQTWAPIFDQQPLLCIGDIELDPLNPDVVYVGTGDPNIGQYVAIGNGLWRSPDGGQTWQHLGLENQRIISKIVIHPTQPNTMWVATMGLPFIRNNDRGLYKTTDGGQTWQQSLFVDNQTGASDVVVDPVNPNNLLAATWVRIRNNQESLVSGTKSGIWRSSDGGSTWTRCFGGLPDNRKSRTGLAIDPTNPQRALAIYADSTLSFHGIYQTLNGGTTWSLLPQNGLDPDFQSSFAWYFGKVHINPFQPQHIWTGGVEMWKSTSGGNTFAQTTPDWFTYEVHADMHDVAFIDANTVLLATDGGLYRSEDNGDSWEKIENIPTTQLYRVAVNPHEPDLYYGGAQDNGTFGGNLDILEFWPRLYGGDGFQPVFHPTDPNIYYYETQNGGIAGTIDGNGFFGATDGIESGDRRFWDMQYFISPNNSDVMYTGTQRVYTSFGHPPLWTPISEDLTDGNIFGSNFHCITSIDESPLLPGRLYVGTNDANVWRGNADNQTWVNITAGLPERYVSSVHPSPTVAERVFVTHTGYRYNDFTPHIHRSDNGGQTWQPIGGDLPPLAVNDLLVIPNTGDSVLCVATDLGVYATLDGGTHWERLGTGMPNVQVFDLTLNPIARTVVAGTHARSIQTFPLDSLLVDEVSNTHSVAQSNKPSLRVNPSPVWRGQNATLQVQPGAGTTSLPANTEVVVLSLAGQTVWQQQMGRQVTTSTIDTRQMAPGVYVACLRVNGKVLNSQKFTVL